MKTIYISDLKKAQTLTDEVFAVFGVQRAEDKTGRPYFNITIGDKTGRVAGKIWSDAFDKVDTKALKEGKLVKVTAKIDEYRGTLQANIIKVEAANETDVENYIETSPFDPDEMMADLLKEVDAIEHKPLRAVIKEMFKDEDFSRKYKFWPAGNTLHHGYRSGLLQHVLEMIEIANGLKKFYPELNYSVLWAGIILHDSGKLEELSGGINNSYTQIGGLLGHITIGAQRFIETARKLNLDTEISNHVTHLILSHHGMLQYGSPVLPSTPEAIALYYIDGVSSKVRGALKAISDIPEGEEFSKPNYYFEGARFWKNHNKQVQENYENDDEVASKIQKEKDDKDQMMLV